jgi:dipeptidyl-peptidase III
MTETRRYLLERVEDAAVVQLYADGFASLSLDNKILVWHLYRAAIAGRDIYYDQRYRHNLLMRDTLETILRHAAAVDPDVLDAIRQYTKLFWINSGPFNNLTARRFVMRVTADRLRDALIAVAANGGVFPLHRDESIEAFAGRVGPLFLDAATEPMVTNKSPEDGGDILLSSACNLYDHVSMADLEAFEERYSLNSRLVKDERGIVEEVYRVGGRYDKEIRRIIDHLTRAIPYAPAETATALRALIRLYQTGEDTDRIASDIAWVRDRESVVDTINGFIEVYLDPRGAKGAWGAIVYYVHPEKTRAIEALAAHAEWFEERMPWEPRFRKADVVGVTARAVEAVIETGDAGPVTAVGVNLPNDQAIREAYGSKSISLVNVSEAYEAATQDAVRVEFSWSAEEAARSRKWGALTSELTTEMHEVIGHGSGRMGEGVTAPPHQLLREHFSAIEEARADLVALYFLPDAKLAELGLVAASDQEEIVRAEYEAYARNALLQLRRVRQGTEIEEDHMRNRHLIVSWLLAHTTAIEVRRRDNKTYYVMTDAAAFREGAGRLLAEVQRIKGDGDYDAAARLLETYGIRFDAPLRDEIVARADALQLPSYTGFVMPRLTPVVRDREIVDIEISYPLSLEAQMLEYSAMNRASDTAGTDVLESPASTH